jgi:hypothetical protein
VTWNHRVVRHFSEAEGEWLGIHEAFYDGLDGEKVLWTNDPVGVTGGSIAELRETLERMLRCLDAPILE